MESTQIEVPESSLELNEDEIDKAAWNELEQCRPVLLGNTGTNCDQKKDQKTDESSTCAPPCRDAEVVICVSGQKHHHDPTSRTKYHQQDDGLPTVSVYCTGIRRNILRGNRDWLNAEILDEVMTEITEVVSQAQAKSGYFCCEREKDVPRILLALSYLISIASIIAWAVSVEWVTLLGCIGAVSLCSSGVLYLFLWTWKHYHRRDNLEDSLEPYLQAFAVKFNKKMNTFRYARRLAFHSKTDSCPAYFVLMPNFNVRNLSRFSVSNAV
eukprot:TRINITY_DN52280_c0_g1_i1.p1 TRINITY_DN52280_c0_g1~~TRINITY_DN52280_c0_g1_i1.p1  ORF type:complete len:269 (-),score=32.54 TRINITY_DN52280_c0_g1_i1:231-1037(-)